MLVRKLKTMVALRLGMKPDDITGDFIRHRRATRTHKLKLDATDLYGGRVSDGLRHLTDEEVASALKTYDHMTAGVKQ